MIESSVRIEARVFDVLCGLASSRELVCAKTLSRKDRKGWLLGRKRFLLFFHLMSLGRLVKKLITATNRADPMIDHMIGKLSLPMCSKKRSGK